MYVTAFRVSARANLENQVLSDARYLMARLADTIGENAIDYEEYYSREVLNSLDVATYGYGQHYGAYGTNFYHPGRKSDGGVGVFPDDIGVYCNSDGDGDGSNDEWTSASGCTIDKRTEDKNTGKNPYVGRTSEGKEATAFCDEMRAGGDCGNVDEYVAEELYLISPDGYKKTIFALEKINDMPSYALSAAILQGFDTDNDNIADQFDCDTTQGFDCTGEENDDVVEDADGNTLYRVPLPADLTTTDDADYHAQNFIPVTPLRLNITSVKFYVTPKEDPRRAFDEPTTSVQQQPHVTIVMEFKPNPDLVQGAAAQEFKTLRLQETVVSRVREVPKSPVSRVAATL